MQQQQQASADADGGPRRHSIAYRSIGDDQGGRDNDSATYGRDESDVDDNESHRHDDENSDCHDQAPYDNSNDDVDRRKCDPFVSPCSQYRIDSQRGGSARRQS